MTNNNAEMRPLPIADEAVFREECKNLMEWVGSIEMPEDRVGIREAGGNIMGILIGLMTASKACFYAEESTNVIALCGYLLESEKDNENRVLVIEAIRQCAGKARDGNTDIEVEFGPQAT